MLAKVRELEDSVDKDFKEINDAIIRQKLDELKESATGSLVTIRKLLLAAEQQLQTQQKQLQSEEEIAKHVQDGKYVSFPFLMTHQAPI